MAVNFNGYVEKMLDRIADRINNIHMTLETRLGRPDVNKWPREIITNLYYCDRFRCDPNKVDGFYEHLFELCTSKRICNRVISVFDIIQYFVEEYDDLKLEGQPKILKRLMYDIDSDESMFRLIDHIDSYSRVEIVKCGPGKEQSVYIGFGLPYNFMVQKAKRPRIEHLPSKALYLEKEETKDESESK